MHRHHLLHVSPVQAIAACTVAICCPRLPHTHTHTHTHTQRALAAIGARSTCFFPLLGPLARLHLNANFQWQKIKIKSWCWCRMIVLVTRSRTHATICALSHVRQSGQESNWCGGCQETPLCMRLCCVVHKGRNMRHKTIRRCCSCWCCFMS